MNLPRVVKFKPRRAKKAECIPKAFKTGRSYADFQSYKEEHQMTSWVELDTVIGSAGGKTIMTFDFTFCNFMFGILLDDKCSASAASAIVELSLAFILVLSFWPLISQAKRNFRVH